MFVLVYIPTSSVRGFLFPPHPCQHLLLVVLLTMAILTGMRWNISVALICISFMASPSQPSRLNYSNDKFKEMLS
jgi:hypothetical protein